MNARLQPLRFYFFIDFHIGKVVDAVIKLVFVFLHKLYLKMQKKNPPWFSTMYNCKNLMNTGYNIVWRWDMNKHLWSYFLNMPITVAPISCSLN